MVVDWNMICVYSRCVVYQQSVGEHDHPSAVSERAKEPLRSIHVAKQ